MRSTARFASEELGRFYGIAAMDFSSHMALQFIGDWLILYAFKSSSTSRDNMNNIHPIYLVSVLALILATSAIALAQDPYEVTALNVTPINSTTTVLDNTSIHEAPLNKTAINQTALNLSTVNNRTLDIVPISEIAGVAPEVAAAAASVQMTYEQDGAIKLGSGVGGWDPFNIKHIDVESHKLDIPIKPMRDTGKMFFVCDIV